MGPAKNGVFYLWIFFNETWHIGRWAWKNNNLKDSLEIAQEINGREPILSKIYGK
jgi:hypothetical protein